MIDPKALGDEIDAGRGRQAFSPEERRLLMVALHAYASRPEAKCDDWRPMISAPLDGTEIEILFRHREYWTALKLEGKEKAEKQWQAVQKAKWIDHNGGGWTWHGMAGSPLGWRPSREYVQEGPKCSP